MMPGPVPALFDEAATLLVGQFDLSVAMGPDFCSEARQAAALPICN